MSENKLDLNDIREFDDMRLHVKSLQEDLWGHVSTIRMFKIKLEKQQEENIKEKNKNFLINFIYGSSLFLLFLVK